MTGMGHTRKGRSRQIIALIYQGNELAIVVNE